MTLLTYAIACLLSVVVHGSSPVDWKSLEVRSLEGKPLAINADGVKATAVVFVTTVCPIANAYQPRLRELQQQFEPQGIQFIQTYPVPGITQETAREHRRQFDIKTAAVLDSDRRIARGLGAQITPEVIVLDRSGNVLYRGRIDDQHAALGKKRPEPTQHNLADALKAIIADKPIAIPETKAVGCSIR